MKNSIALHTTLENFRKVMDMKMNKRSHGRRCLVSLVLLGLALLLIGIPAAGANTGTVDLPAMESGKVMLSWSELKMLLDEVQELKKALENLQDKDKDKKEGAPVAYSIEAADYNGKASGGLVRFKSDFSVRVLKEGWVKIPFLPGNVAIESVEIIPLGSGSRDEVTDERPREMGAVHNKTQLIRDESGYALIAKGPELFKLEISFNIPVQTDDLLHVFSFKPPPSVINRMNVRIDGKGVNLIQTSPVGVTVTEEKATVFQAVLSDRDALVMSWRIEKESGIVRKKHAVMHSLASIGKSAVTVFSKINLKHMASLEEVEFHLPLGVEIINVTSPAIDRWQVEATEKDQIVRVTGQTDRHAAVEISVSYQVRLETLPAQVEVPTIGVHKVDTLEGFLGVEIQGNLEVTSEGVEAGNLIPAKNLPKELWDEAASPLLYGYEFHRNGFKPALNIKSYQEIQTVVANVDLVDCVTHRTLAGKSVTRIQYFIRNNDRQFLTLTLPEHSRIWQAFIDGIPVKPARNDADKILIPMKKSAAQGDELSSFVIEIGYISDVSKLSLKGDIINKLPAIDIPINYLRWSLFLPDYYGYTKFEGPLKQVGDFSNTELDDRLADPLIDIPTQGALFLFEKFLIVEELPYIKGKYGQYLGDDIFLRIGDDGRRRTETERVEKRKGKAMKQQVVPNLMY